MFISRAVEIQDSIREHVLISEKQIYYLQISIGDRVGHDLFVINLLSYA